MLMIVQLRVENLTVDLLFFFKALILSTLLNEEMVSFYTRGIEKALKYPYFWQH